MNTWAPLFSKIVDSSVWMEPDHVRIVFVTMLAKKDADHVVRATAYMIGQWAKKTEAETLDALKILSSPDTKRIEPQPFEGRRVERVEGGWKILNGQAYENLMRSINRRAYKTEHERQRRQRFKRGPDAAEQAYMNELERSGPEAAETLEEKRQDKIKAAHEANKRAVEIYEAYPLKVKKPEALRAISRAIKQFGFGHVLSRTKQYAEIRAGDKSFMPHPASFFNKHQFNDDPSTWKSNEAHKGDNRKSPNRNQGTLNAGQEHLYGVVRTPKPS